DLASARPAGRFLVVSLELCSLAFMRSELSPKMVVAATLFGDGCAAAVVSGPAARGSGPRILAAASHQWRDTEWVMGWDVLDEGLGVVFSTEIPAFVSREIRPVVLEFLKSSRADRPRMLLHPGGAKVLASYRAALDLSEADLADSASVLREYGNMSSPTVLFVLERALSRGALRDGERALLGALGPGFASELALLEG
ncbi:MAG: 3-oxoacyl-[acyl-carrier-protein] synthase III C-terminal domain-containing protein, partial [Methanobacteriota archaeon]